MKSVLLSGLVLALSSTFAPAVVTQFDLVGKGGSGLRSTNEVNADGSNATITGTPGTGGEVLGGISYDDVTGRLTLNVGWGSGLPNGFLNLTGDATAAHIHGPAGQLTTASVVRNLPVIPTANITASASNGGISGYVDALSPSELANLMAGLWYINVHTGSNPGGEIRGNLVPAAIPEPSSLGLLTMALVGLVRRRR